MGRVFTILIWISVHLFVIVLALRRLHPVAAAPFSTATPPATIDGGGGGTAAPFDGSGTPLSSPPGPPFSAGMPLATSGGVLSLGGATAAVSSEGACPPSLRIAGSPFSFAAPPAIPRVHSLSCATAAASEQRQRPRQPRQIER